MGWFILARLLFVSAIAYVAALLSPIPGGWAPNVGFGVALAALVIVLESRLHAAGLPQLIGALLGGAAGLGIAKTIETALFWANTTDARISFLRGVVLLVLPYVGMMIGGRKGELLEPARIIALFRASGPQRRYKILDTSVIIDGRIADVCETGFIDGTLVVPQFVLKELQLVADSGDSLKRNRGRRGLDILQKIQKMAGVEVMISDMDFPEVKEVDLKLIELARHLQGKIVTSTPAIFWIFCRMSRPRRPRLRLRVSAESATSWSSFRTNCGMTSVPSMKPVSQISATRPSMMTLVSRIL
jgi:uncharacterized protein YacL